MTYLDALNKHVVSIFAEIGASADANRDATLSYGWESNPYVNIALSAASHYDLINQKKFIPIWKSVTKFSKAQLKQRTGSGKITTQAELERYYAENPAAGAAIVDYMVGEFLRYGVYLNRFVTPSAPVFLLPLTQQTLRPGPEAASALEDLFDDRLDPNSISLRVIDGADTKGMPFAGATSGSLAVINEPAVRSVARELAVSPQSVREVVVANESVHVYLDRRFGSIVDRKWPLDRLAEFMDAPFELDAAHVEEFLSDVVSIRTNEVGSQFAYLGLFLNAVSVDDKGESTGSALSRYGYSAEFFLRALEKAEIEIGIPQSQRQAAILRQAAAMDDKRAAAKLVSVRPDPRLLSSIRAAYLEMGRRIIDTID